MCIPLLFPLLVTQFLALPSPFIVSVCLIVGGRKHYVKPAVVLEAIIPGRMSPPSSQFQQCNRCIYIGISCRVKANRGPFKPFKCNKCSKCTNSGACCVFSLPFLSPPPLKLSRRCVNCQEAHQTCTTIALDRRCSRCFHFDMKCGYALTSQGVQTDIMASTDPL